MSVHATLPIPVRASPTDEPAEILAFAVDAAMRGGQVALAALVKVRGGAARSPGSHIAVASDGSFCGYVSGGCVEAAAAGEDRTVKFGTDSPFFDIVLPCGGGITVAIHLLRDISAPIKALARPKERRSAALRYSQRRQALDIFPPGGPSGWAEGDFVTVYRPRTRILVCGETVEAAALASIGKAAGYDVVQRARATKEVRDSIDEFTAVVLLNHDLEAEQAILDEALRSSAFYIGALGSTRTHGKRVLRLRANGWASGDIDRIKAPIGLFGPQAPGNRMSWDWEIGALFCGRLVAVGSLKLLFTLGWND
ncbi:XdhC family protein [Ensifer sp. IC4062]|nr:XdhC family protein [Ensifer sp. IC4062]